MKLKRMVELNSYSLCEKHLGFRDMQLYFSTAALLHLCGVPIQGNVILLFCGLSTGCSFISIPMKTRPRSNYE